MKFFSYEGVQNWAETVLLKIFTRNDIGQRVETFGNFNMESDALSEGLSIKDFVKGESSSEEFLTRKVSVLRQKNKILVSKQKMIFNERDCTLVLFETKDKSQEKGTERESENPVEAKVSFLETENDFKKMMRYTNWVFKVIEMLWATSSETQQMLLSKIALINNQMSFFMQQVYDKSCITQNKFVFTFSEFNLKNKLDEIFQFNFCWL